MQNNNKNMSYHLIGIGGIGMSGLARLLVAQGYDVTGSDLSITPLIESLAALGIKIYHSHSKAHVIPGSVVVYSSDIKQENPEFQAAQESDCILLHRADLLAQLVGEKKGLAVAGTHGKTTTSALLATVLMQSQLDPSFAVGGILPAFNTNAHHGNGSLFAFEADESDRSFLKYHPFGAIITNIDRDHLCNYEGSEEKMIDAFRLFLSQVQSKDHLFWCGENRHLTQLNPSKQSYGFSPAHTWFISSFEQHAFESTFDLYHEGICYSQIRIPLCGQHNVLNGAAVFGLAITLGIPEKVIREGFLLFQGVLRRCELKGTFSGIHFIDDYAHHPTEIQTTLEGIRKAIGERRLVVIFQPHRYTRTEECLGLFKNVFDAASQLYITEIYGAGEAEIDGVSSLRILNEIQMHSTISSASLSRKTAVDFLAQFVKSGDVVVTLGAGDITKVGPEVLAFLRSDD